MLIVAPHVGAWIEIYVQNPVSITSGAVVNVDIVTNAIIGQLRGRYAKELEDQDGQNTKSQSSDSEN